MKITIYFFLLTFSGLHAQQYSSKCLMGNWKIIDPYSKEGDVSYMIYKNHSLVSIAYQDNKLLYNVGKFGFVDSPQSEDFDKIYLEDIKNVGSYFISYEVDILEKKVEHFDILDHFYINENCDEMSFGNSKNYDGYRIEQIPHRYIKDLSPQLLYEFFRIKTIKKKIRIHEFPNKTTKTYLAKNDLVEIIEEKNNWLRVKLYFGNDDERIEKPIEGWIKKSDVK